METAKNATNKVSPDTVYLQNLAILSAMLELAGPVMMNITGGEELSNQVGGVTQEQRDLQELVATRIENSLNLS